MTLAEFMKEFSPVLEAFGHQKFPGVVLERIHKKLFDFSKDEVSQLNDLILDHCEHSPKTSRVNELANIVRGRRDTILQKADYTIQCQHCWDMGITRVQLRGDSLDVLMRCDCKAGNDQEGLTILPQYSRQAGELFQRSAPPLEWFKPENWRATGKPLNLRSKEVHDAIEYWKTKKEIAEQYWISNIPELKEKHDRMKRNLKIVPKLKTANGEDT